MLEQEKPIESNNRINVVLRLSLLVSMSLGEVNIHKRFQIFSVSRKSLPPFEVYL